MKEESSLSLSPDITHFYQSRKIAFVCLRERTDEISEYLGTPSSLIPIDPVLRPSRCEREEMETETETE
jgi:hypothetical protein